MANGWCGGPVEHVAADIAKQGRWAANEVGETGRAAARKTPDQTKEQQRENAVTGEPMPIQHPLFSRPPGETQQWHQCPVKQADRQIPDTHAHRRTAHFRIHHQSSARKRSWQLLQVPPRLLRAVPRPATLPLAAAASRAFAAVIMSP